MRLESILAGLVLVSAGLVSAEDPPNVLFIAVDDLNACLDGMNGETFVETPNFSRLAERGVLFSNAHCAAPACNPSRFATLTGLAPSTSGIYLNNQDWRKSPHLAELMTIPHLFRSEGYEVLGGGKIYHAATLREQMYEGYLDPRPWDEFFPSKERQMPAEILPDSSVFHGNQEFYGGRFSWAELDISPDEMADAKVVAWASEKLAKERKAPFFLAVGIYRPHIPWYTPKQYFDLHPIGEVQLPKVVDNDLQDVPPAGQEMARQDWHQWLVENGKWAEFVRGYNASVSFADDMLGRLLDALETSSYRDDTIIVLWSDHGYHLGQKEHWEKFALWEQTTRVPLMISAPDDLEKGVVCDAPVSLLDVYPTLMELCGFELPHQMDGMSLVPLLNGPDTETGRSVVTTQGFQNHAVRSDRWRYIRYEDGTEELYDQSVDPRNFENLADDESFAETKVLLRSKLPKQDAPPFEE